MRTAFQVSRSTPARSQGPPATCFTLRALRRARPVDDTVRRGRFRLPRPGERPGFGYICSGAERGKDARSGLRHDRGPRGAARARAHDRATRARIRVLWPGMSRKIRKGPETLHTQGRALARNRRVRPAADVTASSPRRSAEVMLALLEVIGREQLSTTGTGPRS